MGARLLSTTQGRIRQLLLFVPAYEAGHFQEIYSELINSLPSDIEIIAVAEADAVANIDDWRLEPAKLECLTVLTVPPDWSLTCWARDGLLAAMTENGEPLLLHTPVLDRADDVKVPGLLAQRKLARLTRSSVPFEGGNILLTDDHVFVGGDILSIIGEATEAASLEVFIRALQEVDPAPRRPVVIRSPIEVPLETIRQVRFGDQPWEEVMYWRNKEGTCQPIFHIDMFLSLAGRSEDGRQRVLVGDPALAAEMLGMPLQEQTLAAHFDTIAEDLLEQEFEIIRNPLPLIYMDDEKQRCRTHIFVSSNNVLVQESVDSAGCGNIVWMPAYGHDHWPELSVTDAANRKIWESLGFDVRMVPKGQYLAENLGGLHCLTNVLARG